MTCVQTRCDQTGIWRELATASGRDQAMDLYQTVLRHLPPETSVRVLVNGRVRAERITSQWGGVS